MKISIKTIMILTLLGLTNLSQAEDSYLTSIVQNIKKHKVKTKSVGNKQSHYMDYDLDGKIDAEIMLIGKKLFSRKLDINGDGSYDKSVWFYEEGEVLETITLDTNFDKKIDQKIVKTTKGAPEGFFNKIIYKDIDFDGKYDSKKTIVVNNHQAMGVSSARGASASQRGTDHCINCATGEFEARHLPAILDQESEMIMTDFLDSAGNSSLIDKMTRNGDLHYKVNVQKECYPNEKFGDLLKPNAAGNPALLEESLKTGFLCMENQAIEMQNVRSSEASRERARARTARDNLVQAIGGLIGYDFLANERGSETEFKFTAFHGQRLSLICKAPRNTLDWMESGNLAQQYSSGARAEMRDIYAHATISRRGGLNSHTNRLSSKYSAPNIAFNPNLIEKLNSSWKTEFEGQTKEDKFKELIFHEFLHTSLGTEHSDEEESIDMAETCGNFCFHNPSRNDKVGKEIQSISGEICRGNFVTATPQYKAKMKRLKCLKKIKENSSDHSRSTLPPVGNRAGQCPSGKPELY